MHPVLVGVASWMVHPVAQIIERMERAGVLPDEFTVDAVKNRRSLRTHLKRTFNL